jgi:hypothetical protein
VARVSGLCRNGIRCDPVGASAPAGTVNSQILLGEKEMVMRFTNACAGTLAAVTLALGAGALLSGCKSSEAGAPAPSKTAPAETAPAEKAKPAEKPKGAAAPASSKLSQVKNDMSPEQVNEIMGPPTGQSSYPTGKTFNPYNFGNDSGNRVEYKYKGQGRVVFAVPKWGGNMKVVRVDYDPNEAGK